MNEFQASSADVEFTRVFDAPRELVFACMTRPEHLTHFWGPRGTSAPLDRMHVDLRPTGRFETIPVVRVQCRTSRQARPKSVLCRGPAA